MYEAPEWKISVVYNGVGPHRFESTADPGAIKREYEIGPVDPTILFCGRLTHHKGPDLLLDAAPAVLRYYPSAKFVFLGDGEMRGMLEARARGRGMNYSVRFLGNRGGDELVRLFRMADAVCVPSRNEPFGIVVLEAWSARKPVIVSQNGGPGEYVTHEVNGLKVYPTRDSVAWGIGTLFTDFEKARRMGENGRRVVEASFTWDGIVEKVLLAYEGRDAEAPKAPVVEQAPAPKTPANADEPRSERRAEENADETSSAAADQCIPAEHRDAPRRARSARPWMPLSLLPLGGAPARIGGK